MPKSARKSFGPIVTTVIYIVEIVMTRSFFIIGPKYLLNEFGIKIGELWDPLKARVKAIID